MPKLLVRHPESGDMTFTLSGERITIGRHSDNDIRIAHDTVSKHHAEIICRNGRYLIRDLGSTNRSFIEGVAFTEADLEAACRLVIGTVECDFLPDEVEVGAKEIGTLRKMIGVLRRQNDELISKVSEQKNQIAILGSVKMFSRDAESDIGQLRQQVKELTLDRDTLLTENRALIGELHELRTAAGLGAEVQVARIAAGGGSGFAKARFSPPLTDTAIRTAPLAVLPTPKLDSPFQEIADLTGKLRATASSLSLRPADKDAFDEFVSLIKDTYRIAAILGPHPVATIVSRLDTFLDDAARLAPPLAHDTLQTAIQALVFLSRILTHDMLPRAGKLPPATVIAVDDDADLLAVITASLEITNLRAIGCADARTALDTLQDNHCDVIFLDIGLPDMNGLDMCAAIRGLPKHDRTPIVFLTGDDTAQNRERSTLKGASDFIGKPFTMAEFTLKAHIWALKHRLDLA